MAFIIDCYDQYNSWDRKHTRYVFSINEQEYGIKEVQLEWGTPQLPLKVDRDVEPNIYKVYGSMEEALEFVRQIKRLN